MNILVVPSWCPGAFSPLRGSFFWEQSEGLARLRPDWNIIFLSWDPDTAKLLTRHPSWLLHNLARIPKRLATGGVRLSQQASGLYMLNVWSPVWRTNTPEAMLRCLRKHLAKGLAFLKEKGLMPDVIHAHASMPAGKAACEIFKQKHIPYILTEHMSLHTWRGLCQKNSLPKPEIYEAFAEAKKIFAVSNSLRRELRQYNLSNDIAILPNGVNSDIFIPGQRKKDGKVIFLSIGWPSKEKGTDILLESFSKLHKKHSNTALQIIGSSAEEAGLKNLATSLGIQHVVTWKGNIPRKDVPAILADCDIFVLPSQTETFGVAYVEALMCGKPIIATACGGPEDIVKEHNGLLIPVNDVDALTNAMQRMMNTAFSSEKIREDAIDRFSIKNTSFKIAHILEKL